jgi:hypothetical protein
MRYSLNHPLTKLPVLSEYVIYLTLRQLCLTKYSSKTVAPNSNLRTFGIIYLVTLKV